MGEVLLRRRNGVTTTVDHCDGRRHFILRTDQQVRDMQHAMNAAERDFNTNKLKYKKIGHVDEHTWVKWSLELGVPLHSLHADDRDKYIRRKLRDQEWEKLRTCHKV